MGIDVISSSSESSWGDGYPLDEFDEDLKSAPFVPPLQRASTIQPANIYLELIDLYRTEERQTGVKARISSLEISRITAEDEKTEIEKQKALASYAEDMKERDTWGILGTVAQYIASAATITLGLAFITTGVGVVPGYLLVASGGLGLANRILTDTGGWEAIIGWFTESEELQMEIAKWIDISMFSVTAALALAGGIWGYQVGAFGAASAPGVDNLLEKASTGIGLASGAMSCTARIGKAVTEKRMYDILAALKIMNSQTTLNNEQITETLKGMEKVIRDNQSVLDVVQEGIEASRVY
jgi:hypothetical protein